MAGTRWQAVAALVDPVRRALYDHVRRQEHPVTREEAAEALAISRNLTAFHLDKLVSAGLLRARYEAPADQPRSRGRAPKVYEPSDAGLTLNVPPRQYELVGEILVDAVAAEPTDAKDAAERRAIDAGRRVGLAHVGRTQCDTDIGSAYTALADLGFEPRTGADGELSLGNCPFHALAVRQPELVCGLNEAFIGGLLDGIGAKHLFARLQPHAGSCCVRVAPLDDRRATVDATPV